MIDFNQAAFMKSCKSTIFKAITIASLSVATIPGLSLEYSMIPISNAAVSQYLKEPTDDFKEEMKRSEELRKKDIEIRKAWDGIVDEIKASDDPVVTAASIKKLNVLLNKIQTVPIGVKKLDLVKTCRAKKFEGKKIKKTWTKEVEIEYEAMIQQFNKQFYPKNPGDKTI